MKKFFSILIFSFLIIIFTVSCNNESSKKVSTNENSSNSTPTVTHSITNESGTTIEERFAPPEGYKRGSVSPNSFQEYLRTFPLKPHGSSVEYFNGKIKENYNTYSAVLNIDIGERDLQQCADAIMRLRAEYLYKNKEYDKIHFNFVNGFNAEYSKWINGYRIAMNSDNSSWVKKTSPSTDYESFRKYLNVVFAYAGTASLNRELTPVNMDNMQIGDIFIQTKSPYGHAEIVVDMAENDKGEKVYMLAQSYMPAQSIHIVCNRHSDNSPWYKLDRDNDILTPEWSFTPNDLKRFPEK